MPRRAPVYTPLIPRARDLSPEALATEYCLTQEEAAGELRVSLRMVERLVQSGELPSVKIGRRRVVLTAGMTAYLASLIREQRAQG